MRIFVFIFCPLLFLNCQGESEVENVTGTLMEIEPDQLELDGIALVEQPQTVQDFFAVKNDLIGDDYCYNYSSISQLILYGNNDSEEWEKFELSDNYLTAYHSECDVLLEFMTFDLNGEKKAFLSQMNGSNQQFDYLSWNSKTSAWMRNKWFAHPNLDDYFDFLEKDESNLVSEYGVDFIYINPHTTSATFLFSEESMALNMGEKEQFNFSKNPNYYFELAVEDNGLRLKREISSPVKNLKTYILGCSNTENTNELFRAKYEALILEIKSENMQHKMTTFEAPNFQVYFKSDTLDVKLSGQTTDAFWLFKSGKDPIEISASANLEEVVRATKTYFEISD